MKRQSHFTLYSCRLIVSEIKIYLYSATDMCVTDNARVLEYNDIKYVICTHPLCICNFIAQAVLQHEYYLPIRFIVNIAIQL